MTVVAESNIILNWTNENISKAPNGCGVYVLRNFPTISGIVYIGYSHDLQQRLREHYMSRDIPEIRFFDWYQTDSIDSAIELEKSWIEKYSPKHNERIG